MDRTLRRTVIVDGAAHPAGTTPPPAIAERITNPRAWNGAASAAAPAQEPDDSPPPRAGKGSGRDEWAAYAARRGVNDLANDASRDDIIAALEERGLLEEG